MKNLIPYRNSGNSKVRGGLVYFIDDEENLKDYRDNHGILVGGVLISLQLWHCAEG